MNKFIYDPCPHCDGLVENVTAWPGKGSSLRERVDVAMIEIQPCGHIASRISIHAWPVIDEHGNKFPDPPYQVSFGAKLNDTDKERNLSVSSYS